MPRASQLLRPFLEPAAPRPAATMLLLRDAPDGPEVLLTQHSTLAHFVPGTFSFPSGGVEMADAVLAQHASQRPTQDNAQRTWAVTAIRETFRETGILLARDAAGAPLATDAVATLDRRAPLAALCARNGWTLAADRAYLLARWITSRDLPQRYDASFLLARMPPGQALRTDQTGQFQPTWIRPTAALERHAAGDCPMTFTAVRTLERLRGYPTVDSMLLACSREHALWTSCPRAGLRDGVIERHTEDDAPFGELELTCPDGQLVHTLDWQSERPVPLLNNVQRLTAANAGFMTGPGTNTYIVGDTTTGFAVIDPGPNDPAHLHRLIRATAGDIRTIICTHSHPDHAPGARPLQALVACHPPILGLPSAPTARANSHFIPDRALGDNERIVLSAPSDGLTHTLRVLHTPGHATNHLCLILEEDGLLFSGDHILNGSTTVIDPPDGNMGDYLASLMRLDGACRTEPIDFILPAHGYVLGQPRRVIALLHRHRLMREAKVRAAMRARPDGTPDDWLAQVYDDVPQSAWPVARRSLLAHVEHVRAQTARES